MLRRIGTFIGVIVFIILFWAPFFIALSYAYTNGDFKKYLVENYKVYVHHLKCLIAGVKGG